MSAAEYLALFVDLGAEYSTLFTALLFWILGIGIVRFIILMVKGGLHG